MGQRITCISTAVRVVLKIRQAAVLGDVELPVYE